MIQAEWRKQFVKGTYDRSPTTLRRVAEYCLQDCRTEIAVGAAVGPLTPYERRVWELDQRINQRGLRIDIPYVRACLDIVEQAARPLLAEFDKLTGGLQMTQVKALTAWCAANGFAIESLAKDNLRALGITRVDEEEDDGGELRVGVLFDARMPDIVRKVLEIRSVLGSSSIAKLTRMLICVNADGRVRYTQQYHGAHTGRTAGRLIQPTNFPRGKIEGGHDPDQLVSAIHSLSANYVSMLYGDPIAAVASGLRHAIISADGHEFNTGDFAGIEARVVLALAGQHDKIALIASGQNPYYDFGAIMFGHPITKDNLAEYIPAKSGVLGCGFQCGPPNFNIKFLGGTDLPLAEKVVKTYRENWAPEVPKLWRGLEDASLRAVQSKGRAEAYGIVYQWHPHALACHIPDGQIMWYRNAQSCLRPMPWDATDIRPGWSYWAMKEGRWTAIHAYGGLLTENVVQKIARGFLVAACERLEANNLPLVLTVYDECMSEIPLARSDIRAYEQVMAEPTPYSRALRVPIAVEGWAGRRYRK